MIFCKDCKHIERDSRGEVVPLASCHIFERGVSLVTGRTIYLLASDNRNSGPCGAQGSLFEAREHAPI